MESEIKEPRSYSLSSEFVPYELALKMRDLGYDWRCLQLWEKTILFTMLVDPSEFKKIASERYCKAPTWQAAFRWFREKYNLHSIIGHDMDNYYYTIQGVNEIDFETFESNEEGILCLTYEEIEEKCLKRLIKIVEYFGDNN